MALIQDQASDATDVPMQQRPQEQAGGATAEVHAQPGHQLSLASAAAVGVQLQRIEGEAQDQVAIHKDGRDDGADVGAQWQAVTSAGVQRWKRLHRQEQDEKVMLQAACVKHAVFGIPTPPNSGSDLSGGKAAFAAMLEGTTGSKRRSPDEDKDMVLSMNSSSTDSIEFRGALDMSVTCKRVCVERVESVVGIEGSAVHITEEIVEGEEEDQNRRESVGDGKEIGGISKKLPALGLPVN